MSDSTALLARVSAPEGSGRAIPDAATGEVICARAHSHPSRSIAAPDGEPNAYVRTRGAFTRL